MFESKVKELIVLKVYAYLHIFHIQDVWSHYSNTITNVILIWHFVNLSLGILQSNILMHIMNLVFFQHATIIFLQFLN